MKKNSINIALLLVTTLFFIGLASAQFNVSLYTTPFGGVVAGKNFSYSSQVINCTITHPTYSNTGFNCTFYVKSSSTGNNSWVNIGTAVNQTEAANYTSLSWDSRVVEDASNYVFNATCFPDNETADINYSELVSGVGIDNTVPTAPSSLTSGTTDDTTPAITATVNDASTNQDCTLFFNGRNPGATSYTMTYSGSTCTTSDISLPDETYEYYVRASDGTNTTDSGVSRITIDTDTTLSGNLIDTETGKNVMTDLIGKGIPNELVIVLVVVLVIAIIIYKRNH
jgi:hypothetical protein